MASLFCALILLLAAGAASAAEKKACKPAVVDVKLAGTYFEPNNQCRVLKKACLRQETVISFDYEAANKGNGAQGLPVPPEMKDIQYVLRRARTIDIAKSVARAENNATLAELASKMGFSVQTVNIPFITPIFRYPSRVELDLAADGFSQCTVPMIIYQHWPHSNAEFLLRTPALLQQLLQHKIISPENLAIVIATAGKLPLDRFNYDYTEAFSELKPSSFAEFSDIQPKGTPSQSFAEGVHMRCFEHLLVCKFTSGSYPHMCIAGRNIVAREKDKLPPSELFSSKDAETLRVLVELRNDNDTRQFLDVDKLFEACNSQSASDSIAGLNKMGFKRIECRPHIFGSRGFLYDLAVLQQTNMMVGFHGGGNLNMVFMKEGSAIVEVRPREFGTKHRWWPNMWYPLVSDQCGAQVRWFGLNVEDPSLSEPSLLERLNLIGGGEAARDRFVRLKWEHLKPIIDVYLGMDGNLTLYRHTFKESKTNFLVDERGQFGINPQHMYKNNRRLARRAAAETHTGRLAQALQRLLPHALGGSAGADATHVDVDSTYNQLLNLAYSGDRPPSLD